MPLLSFLQDVVDPCIQYADFVCQGMESAPAQRIVALLFGPRTDVAGPSFTELDGSTFSAARIVD